MVPVIGVIEPGARAAVRASRSGKIGVIGTEATIASGAYTRERSSGCAPTRKSTRAPVRCWCRWSKKDGSITRSPSAPSPTISKASSAAESIRCCSDARTIRCCAGCSSACWGAECAGRFGVGHRRGGPRKRLAALDLARPRRGPAELFRHRDSGSVYPRGPRLLRSRGRVRRANRTLAGRSKCTVNLLSMHLPRTARIRVE